LEANDVQGSEAIGSWHKQWDAGGKGKPIENKYSTSVKLELENFIKENNVKVKQ
jgi:hypothetical protein